MLKTTTTIYTYRKVANKYYIIQFNTLIVCNKDIITKKKIFLLPSMPNHVSIKLSQSKILVKTEIQVLTI